MCKLSAKLYADSLLDLLSHCERDSHTVHTFTQGHLLPPLTSIMKLSLFTHAHSSLLSLAGRLHLCHVNRSCYINSGWTFPRLICVLVCLCIHTCTYICICVYICKSKINLHTIYEKFTLNRDVTRLRL